MVGVSTVAFHALRSTCRTAEIGTELTDFFALNDDKSRLSQWADSFGRTMPNYAD
jgi:hypothetical protein